MLELKLFHVNKRDPVYQASRPRHNGQHLQTIYSAGYGYPPRPGARPTNHIAIEFEIR